MSKNKSWCVSRNFASPMAIMVLALLSQSRGQQAPPPVTQWPLRVDSPDGLLTTYEPQPEKFEGDTLTARAAVSLTPPGATDPEFGAMWFTARVLTDRDSRIVTIQNISVRQVKLPNASDDQEKQFAQVLQQQIPPLNVSLPLDQLEATLGVVQKAKLESQQLDNNPPMIVFTKTPTTLVTLDGPPKLQQSSAQGVMAVVNTPFIMLLDLPSKQYFLKAGSQWMVAPDVTGSWSPTNSVPVGIADAAAKMASQAAPAAGAPAQSSGPTQIMVAEQPTELISSTGDPTYTPLPGNDLLYMSNTESDVFLEVTSQQYYVLLSGRWYQSRSLQGPWAFTASDKLPTAFAQIPPDSAKGSVLVSVAGTQPAKDARLDAYIPQTTVISRSSGTSLTVNYDGDPQFVPVQDTPITYASNCADPVLFVDNSYYCCHQAVWYRGGAARGPWAVCDSVPQVIYTLPPSCPIYNCRYCYVYDSTPDVVYCGYLPGYTGCYVYGPTIVYGTGYYYPSWYATEFIPRPYTWGFAPRYDYAAGSWAYGASFAFGPTWFVNSPDRHNWFGPQGYVDYHEIRGYSGRGYSSNESVVNNRSDVRNVTNNRINIYNRSENVKRNVSVSINRSEVINNGHTRDATASAKATKAYPAAENNVYAGHDGQVYRRTDQGWEAHSAKGWEATKSVPEASPQPVRSQHAENIPQHVAETPHEVQATPHEVQTHETPAKETPDRATSVREAPSRETPIRSEPAQETPAREAPSGGLEEEHAARERGSDRPTQSAGNPRAGGGGGESGGPGNAAARSGPSNGAGNGGNNPGGGKGNR